ncbi:MAG TPA: AMP-binding protein, partial [Candidatus Hydrogenedentes bacterium]|nr:AMP-binding protein [Candidatus Hydrogenedentota bacterium]
MLNLAHFLQENAEKYPSTTAVMLDQHQLTYEQVALYARKVAGALKARGIQKGDRVAMMIPNTPHFPIIYYGILHAGAVVVPVNVLFQHEEIRHYLQDSGAKAFFAFKLFEEQARKAAEAAPECKHFIVVSAPDDLTSPEYGENFNLFLAGGEDVDIEITSPDDTAVILYTSGTTGAPKGAELSHFNMFFNAYYSARDIVQSRPGDVALVTLPLFHSFGQTCLMNAGLLSGATLTMLPRFETEKAMQVIARDRVTIVAMVPTMYFFILNHPEWQKYD